jgi:hypothetical protein
MEKYVIVPLRDLTGFVACGCFVSSSVTELHIEGQASTLAHLGLDSRNFLIFETCAGGDTSVLYWLQQEAHYC